MLGYLAQGKWRDEVDGLTKLSVDGVKNLYVAQDMETATGDFMKAVGK